VAATPWWSWGWGQLLGRDSSLVVAVATLAVAALQLLTGFPLLRASTHT
jgi:hypothetical protein